MSSRECYDMSRRDIEQQDLRTRQIAQLPPTPTNTLISTGPPFQAPSYQVRRGYGPSFGAYGSQQDPCAPSPFDSPYSDLPRPLHTPQQPERSWLYAPEELMEHTASEIYQSPRPPQHHLRTSGPAINPFVPVFTFPITHGPRPRRPPAPQTSRPPPSCPPPIPLPIPQRPQTPQQTSLAQQAPPRTPTNAKRQRDQTEVEPESVVAAAARGEEDEEEERQEEVKEQGEKKRRRGQRGKARRRPVPKESERKLRPLLPKPPPCGRWGGRVC